MDYLDRVKCAGISFPVSSVHKHAGHEPVAGQRQLPHEAGQRGQRGDHHQRPEQQAAECTEVV